MSRLAGRFAQLKQAGQKALVPYLTAGDPNLETTLKLALACEQAGADILELGIPFSDPLADGPTIQAAAQRALAAGTTLGGILDVVRRIRVSSTIPIVFLVYYNTICRRGEERFILDCAQAGVDGLVIPDLPIEASDDLRSYAQLHSIDLIQLVAPASTPERKSIAIQVASGFLYCVSLNGVTGAREALPPEFQQFITSIRTSTTVPLVVGFGISKPEHAKVAAAHADGVIVGSALIAAVATAYGAQGAAAAVETAHAFLAPFRASLDTL